jgi:hypothetical protein
MMEEVDRGFMHPRMFEVFSGLSKTIAEINKQLIGTVEAIKLTYKDVKNDIREQQTEALGASTTDGQGMITQGDGGVVTMGTKELIKNNRRKPKPNIEEVQDIEELMILEKQLIFKHKPVLNISHKYKLSNRLY